MIRKIGKVKSGTIKVDLPDEYNEKTVEIVISKIDASDTNLTELLLSAPIITDDELNEYNQVRELMNTWTVKKF